MNQNSKLLDEIPIYATLEQVTQYYSITLDKDKQEQASKYIVLANDRINLLSGNAIEKIGFDNLTIKQRLNVQRAVGRYFLWLIEQGQAWFKGNVSFSRDGLSVSQSEANEPDFILQAVYDFLQVVGLFKPKEVFKKDNFSYGNYQPHWNNSGPWGDSGYPLSAFQTNHFFCRADKFFVNGINIKPTYEENGTAKINIIATTEPTIPTIYNFIDSPSIIFNTDNEGEVYTISAETTNTFDDTFLKTTNLIDEPTPTHDTTRYQGFLHETAGVDEPIITVQVNNPPTPLPNNFYSFPNTTYLTTNETIRNNDYTETITLNSELIILKSQVTQQPSASILADSKPITIYYANNAPHTLKAFILNETLASFLLNYLIDKPTPSDDTVIYETFLTDNHKWGVQIPNPITPPPPSTSGITQTTPWIEVPTGRFSAFATNGLVSHINSALLNNTDIITTNEQFFDFITDNEGQIKWILGFTVSEWQFYVTLGTDNIGTTFQTMDNAKGLLEIIQFGNPIETTTNSATFTLSIVGSTVTDATDASITSHARSGQANTWNKLRIELTKLP